MHTIPDLYNIEEEDSENIVWNGEKCTFVMKACSDAIYLSGLHYQIKIASEQPFIMKIEKMLLWALDTFRFLLQSFAPTRQQQQLYDCKIFTSVFYIISLTLQWPLQLSILSKGFYYQYLIQYSWLSNNTTSMKTSFELALVTNTSHVVDRKLYGNREVLATFPHNNRQNHTKYSKRIKFLERN